MPSFTQLTLPDRYLAEMIGHARATLPHECCGLLAGVIQDGVGHVAVRFGIRNEAGSTTEYLTNAEDLLAAYREIAASQLQLLAVYHSHPTALPVPSPRDLQQNTYGDQVVHMIVAFSDGGPQVQAWWLSENEAEPAEWARA